jgi:Flp pilus assembly protein TadG
MSILSHLLRRFARDEKGSIVVEAIMVMPMFIWAYAGLFAYWDAYRSINTVQKAAYTISDLISRSQNSVNDAYIAGMRTAMNSMVDADQAGEIRVTSYTWSSWRNRYEVIFSRSPNSAMPSLTTSSLAGMTNRLPTMSDGDSAILVEVEIPYTPPVAFGLTPTTIEQFIVTRPRFLPKLCHTSFTC